MELEEVPDRDAEHGVYVDIVIVCVVSLISWLIQGRLM